MQEFRTAAAIAVALHLLSAPATAADNKAVCDRVAALGPEALKAVMLPTDDGEIAIDIDGDKVDERLRSRWEITSMHPHLWFIETAKGEPYLGDGTHSVYFEDEKGSVFESEFGYETVWIRLDGDIFALGMFDERHVIATELTRFKRGKAVPLCTFDHTTTVEWTPAEAGADEACRLANAGKADAIAFGPAVVDWKTGLRPPMVETSSAARTSADINNDGAADKIVRWSYASGAGRGCDLKWLDIDQDSPDPALRKALLEAQGFQATLLPGQDPSPRAVLPRDEFGWTRCGDTNDVVRIGSRIYVRAADALASLAGNSAHAVCQGKKTTRWRVKQYAK